MTNLDPNDAIELIGSLFGCYAIGYVIGLFLLTFKKGLEQI